MNKYIINEQLLSQLLAYLAEQPFKFSNNFIIALRQLPLFQQNENEKINQENANILCGSSNPK